MRKTNNMIQENIDQIGRLLSLGVTDREIMERLQIKKSQYYVYRTKLYKQHADTFNKSRMEDLAFHKNTLSERLTRLYRQAEIKLNNPAMSQKDTAQVLAMAQNIATNIFKLEIEGLRILDSQRISNLARQEGGGQEGNGIDNGSQRYIDSESGRRIPIRLLPVNDGEGEGSTIRYRRDPTIPSIDVDPEKILDESEVF